MNVIVDMIFRQLIVRFIGVYIRYFFFKIIGKEKSLMHLRGEDMEDPANAVMQDFFNAVIGMFVPTIIIMAIAYFLA